MSLHFQIAVDKEGAREFTKVSYPIRYGRFHEIATPDYIFQFNLNGEIKYIQGRDGNWPHPAEWLKRTVGNDWVYYSAMEYSNVYDLIGEYYFPFLSYPSNSIISGNPLDQHAVKSAIRALGKVRRKLRGLISSSFPEQTKDFLIRVSEKDARALKRRSQRLHDLIGGHVTVLPPDTRHVDYDVIPIIIADGCLYNCGFCRVKSGRGFMPRSKKEILRQIKGLRQFYGRDLSNYNAIFLGQHDALRGGRELIEFAATHAYEVLGFQDPYLRGPRLFLFGSIDSLIDSEDTLFQLLNALPFSTYINIGLESADPETLAVLKKPVPVEMMREAFDRMIEINRRYEKIEITANFVLGDDLPPSHLSCLMELTNSRLDQFSNKGCIYLSPLIDGRSREEDTQRGMVRKFKKVKSQIRLPTFIYLIQRL